MPRYFDHAATTPADPRVIERVLPLLAEPLNASSVHQSGQRARRLLDEARQAARQSLGLRPGDPLVFTSGATEAANLALRGFCDARPGAPPVIACSAIEHSCVRDTVEFLAASGRCTVRPLAVAGDGRVVLEEGLMDGVDLLCLMAVNNETGVVQDSAGARALRERMGFRWLCDASQAVGRTAFDAAQWGADAVVASSHKVYGPPGAGCLAGPMVESLAPQVTGGPQEDEHRAGTEALPWIVGFAEALRLAVEEGPARRAHLATLEAGFLGHLAQQAPGFRINGSARRAPGFVNLSFPGHQAVDLVIALDQQGMRVSPGSACSTGVVAISPVLDAMYPGDGERAAGGIRVTFGRDNTLGEARELAAALALLANGSHRGAAPPAQA